MRTLLSPLPNLGNISPGVPGRLRLLRTLSTSIPNLKKNDQLPPRPNIPDDSFTKRFLKGSGPGGQKINKTSSAVQLTHLQTGIVVKSQATRSRTQNEHIARRILAEKLELIEKGTESRVAKKQERASRKKRSAEKKSRRKYRKLADENPGVRAGEEGRQDEDLEEESEEDKDEEELGASEVVKMRIQLPLKPTDQVER
ncbi:hypothetical protein H2198_003351 [Neophaeococcomyces mojaviensis]|uniref:Uncharacterized protein n=1 Tax=Neophaeococcomyces mojaviensis TaxID=3383035 RepID=A0ACC3ABL7_9EURO|nr:hypothetical protein H2198_003351 [Knufia sp. JES_112]